MKNETSCKVLPAAVFLAVIFVFAGINSARAQSVTPIFEESFENLPAVQSNGGTANGVSFVPGKNGNGVLIDGTDTLSFPAAGNFNFSKGTIEFWVKPNWNGNEGGSKSFFNIVRDPAVSSKSYFNVYKMFADYNWFQVDFVDQAGAKAASIHNGYSPSWRAGEWHRARIYWDFTLPIYERYMLIELDDRYGVYTTSPGYANWYISTVLGDFGDTSSSRFFIGSKFDGNNRLDGVIDELKIWDQSILAVKPLPSLPSFQFNPKNPETVATFRKLYDNDGYCSSFENHNDAPADCPKLSDSIESGKSVIFFKTPAFQSLFENHLPNTADIGTEFGSLATPGENKSVFFNAYSRSDLSNVRIDYTALSGPNGTIPKESIDMRVVKNWYQGGLSAGMLPSYTPELLLPDDQADLHQRQLWIGGNFEAPPSVPKSDHAQTKIAPNTSKQFAMMIKVPETAAAGTYTSTVTLSADGIAPQTATVKFEVLPFVLRNSEKLHSTWHPFDEKLIASPTTAQQNGVEGMTEDEKWELIRKNLVDMKDHGFDTLLTIYGYCWGTNEDISRNIVNCTKQLNTIREVGFKNVIMYQKDVTDFKPLVDLMKSSGFEPLFWGFDEVGAKGGDYGMVGHIQKSIQIHQAGGKIVANGVKSYIDRLSNCTPGDPSAPHDPIYDALDASGNRIFPPGTCEPADWAAYAPGAYGGYVIEVMAGTAEKTPNRPESIWWQTYNEDARVYRYLCGHMLGLSKLDMCMPSYYMNRAATMRDYYNEYDYWDPNNVWKPYMMAYPSKEGPVPTLQLEAHRESIYDERYLATWRYYKDLVAQTDPVMAASSETVVSNILNKYRDTSVALYYANYTAMQRVPLSDYETDRKVIAAEIVKLKNAAGGSVPSVSADLNSDTKIDLADFDILKTDFLKLAASLVNPKSDINSDGQATIRDIGIMMSQWRP